ncbi:hypothetical protein [Streptomyces sp. SP2-10]|uniref:hypothetical protein n=1 Tax=Streptomyces sp. SP2-10 TaxID=2873385 RepID=UPI001CA6517A|nr:hypothetical protein [Streptomyces sp. SP2-10]MBY8845623.1 hypothetical protein [Streptomyces sp. SP2-10]
MYGLADKGDPRCVEASRRIRAGTERRGDDWMLDAADRHEERRARAEEASSGAH